MPGSAYMKSLGQAGDWTSDLRQQRHNSRYFSFGWARPTKNKTVIIEQLGTITSPNHRKKGAKFYSSRLITPY